MNCKGETMSYTKGEWKIEWDDKLACYILSSKSFTIGTIAFKDDAQLIASAPDLLEALEWMVNHKSTTAQDYSAGLYRARKAINKAKGIL